MSSRVSPRLAPEPLTAELRAGSVEQHFQSVSPYWKDVYTQNTLNGALYRDRRAAVLGFADQLFLPMDASVLEVGCGAGSTSVALAQRGYCVQAVDSVAEMARLTQEAARAHQMSGRVTAQLGDVHQLKFTDDCFDLALAIGVMEWMPSYTQPLSELFRVLRPGGHLIVNVDNARALHCLLDPRMYPIVSGAKRMARKWAERAGAVAPVARPTRCSRSRFDAALTAAGFRKIASRTGGFGPFTLLGLRILPDAAGVRLHHQLQKWADGGRPWIREGGETYLVLVQKPTGEPE